MMLKIFTSFVVAGVAVGLFSEEAKSEEVRGSPGTAGGIVEGAKKQAGGWIGSGCGSNLTK